LTDIRPGFVTTAFIDDGHKYPMQMKPESVAIHIVRALKHHKRVVTIDFRYKLLVFFWRLLPRWLWERMPVRN
jgi:short-subunit dehydrogenase